MKTKNTTPVRTNNYGYVPLVVSIIMSFLLLWLITWFLFRITRWVQPVKQELYIIPEHSSSPTFVSGDGFTLILIFCVVFCRLLFACLPFFYSPLYCISLFDLWLLIITLTSSNVLFMHDVMQIYTLLLFTKTKYGINKMYTINQYQIRVITKLLNSEQSYKGKVKTHKYINRQNPSTTGKLWKPWWPWLDTGISKEMVCWIRF
jgi:hypothetical protein